MEIEFHGHYKKQQYLKALYLFGKPSLKSTLIRVAAFVVFASLLIYLFTTLQSGDISSRRTVSVVRNLITVALLFYYIFQPYIHIITTANSHWRDPKIRGLITGSISSEGVILFRQLIPWDRILTKYVTDDLVVLVTLSSAVIPLPRDLFKHDGDWNRFLRLTEYHIKNLKGSL